jgi:Ferritin-like
VTPYGPPQTPKGMTMEPTSTGTAKRKIIELMRVPSQDHDPDWLKTSLQAAVELEMSTIPPYLCAMWSIKDPADPVHGMIRDIVLEEMSHLGTACNMLTAVGGTPALNTSDAVPTYPGPLPGGVHPGLVVSLSGLTKDVVKSVFMEIELPESGPLAFAEGMAFPTIGAFYDSILQAFQQIPPGTVTGERQLNHPFGGPADLIEIHSVADAETAIARIKQQGEGTAQSPVGDPLEPGYNLAHYYQFAEIWHGRRLVASNGTFEFTGDPIPFPDVFPMAIVPPEGYPKESADFDKQYKSLLDGLQAAWTTGNSDELLNAIGVMDSMGDTAVSLMQTPLPTGQGTFGPDFKLPTSN